MFNTITVDIHFCLLKKGVHNLKLRVSCKTHSLKLFVCLESTLLYFLATCIQTITRCGGTNALPTLKEIL